VAGDARPRYRQVADELTRLIGDGTYPVESKLPPKRELAAQFGVSVSMIERVQRILAEDGLVQSVQGVAVYVVNARPSRPLTDRERIDRLESRLDRIEKHLGI
jgi:DNA-binding GntR family transcriptional regulator